MQNLYLFTWENRYELWQELQRRRTAFVEKNGAESVAIYHSENWNLWEIKQSFQGGGLFISKKMLILEWLPLETEATGKLKADQYEKLVDDLMGMKNGLPEEVYLICVSYKPDKRGRFYKWIVKEGQVKEFWLHDKRGLTTFLKQAAGDLKMSDDVVSYLIEKVGTDQYRLMSEVEKLRYFKESEKVDQISFSVLDEVVFGQTEANGFTFFDFLLDDPLKAVQVLEKLQREGNDWNQVSGMLFWGLRNYLVALDLEHQGIRDAKVLASEGKMAPFAASKLIGQMEKIIAREVYLKGFFKKLVEMDYDLKQVILPVEFFWLGVKKMVLQ